MARLRPAWAVLLILAITAVVIYAADQLSKLWVVSSLTEGIPLRVWGDLLVFQFVRNPGAAFSFASGATWVFSLLALAVVVVIIVFARRIRSLAWAIVFGLLLGGTLGNLTDRLTREPGFGQGHVIDFISTPWMMPAIYNVADIAIVTSMVLLVLLILLGFQIDGTRAVKTNAAKDMNYGANATVTGANLGIGPSAGTGTGNGTGTGFGGSGGN